MDERDPHEVPRRHQAPEFTDLEYAAEINDLDGVAAFIEAHQAAPWLASMVGFVAGLLFLYQMVLREREPRCPSTCGRARTPLRSTVGEAAASLH